MYLSEVWTLTEGVVQVSTLIPLVNTLLSNYSGVLMCMRAGSSDSQNFMS